MSIFKLRLEGREVELKPPREIICPPDGAQPAPVSAMAKFWGRYGGAIQGNAERHGLEPALALAVMFTEAGPLGAFSAATGLVTIRVEARPPVLSCRRFPHGGAEFREKYGSGQKGEWAALQGWAAQSGPEALRWTSFGLGQIMGFNHRLAGLASPLELLLRAQRSATGQVDMFFELIRRQGSLAPLKAKAWAAFARLYNGPGQVDYYAGQLAGNYARAAGVV